MAALYLGDRDPGDRPDAGTAADCASAIATCADAIVTLAEAVPGDCPTFDPPRAVATCPTACTTDYAGLCFDPGCATPEYLCEDPPAAPLPPVLACPDAPATCDGTATTTCGGLGLCGQEIRVGTCACADGVRTCTPACADGLCSAQAVQAAMVGRWVGTVVTPWETYPAELAFTADGHYAATRPGPGAALYYGVDGGGDARRFVVVGQTSSNDARQSPRP